MESFNLTADTRNQFQSFQKFMFMLFECVMLSNLWLKLLTIIQETNRH